MAGSLNRAELIGHVGRDPEIRYLPNGDAAATLSLATSKRWKDKQSGEQREHTEWHRCVAFGRLAEIIGEYVHKGSYLRVEGELRTRKWQDKDGSDRYTTEISLREMLMLDSKGGGSQDDGDGEAQAPQRRPAPASPPPRQQARQPQPATEGADDFPDDDIPF